MKLIKERLEDPALNGYSNPPIMVLEVEPEPYYEVWGDFGIDLTKMQPHYYIGRAGSDQFNLVDNVTVNSFVLFADASSRKDRFLYVVWQMGLEYTGRYTNGLAEKTVPVVFFQVYDLGDCRRPSGYGALTHKIDEGVTLVNGWSSNSGAFNSTGIMPVHVMEVALESNGRRVSAGSCIPVTAVEELNRASDFYRVGKLNYSTPNLYSLHRLARINP
jgi:hypothetical protein